MIEITAASVTSISATRVGQTDTVVEVTVSVSDPGCTGATEFYVEVDGTAVTPNPSASPFTVDTTTDCRDAEIEVWYADPQARRSAQRTMFPPSTGTSATDQSGGWQAHLRDQTL